MKFEKKHWMMLVAGLVVLFLVYWFFFRKKKVAESSYNPAVPIWGIGMGEPSESNYINCAEGQCKITYKYFDGSQPPVLKEGTYCGSCSTGMPARSVKASSSLESNYVSGGGTCFIKWTDDKGVQHLEEVPCSRLKGVIGARVVTPSASALGKK